MADMTEYSLDDVAERFRRAASSDPQWSEPSAGTWEAIAAATGVAVAAPQPSVGDAPAGAAGAEPALSRRTWLFGAGGLLAGLAIGAAGMAGIDAAGEDSAEAVSRAELTPLDRPDERLGTAELLRRNTGYSLAVEVPEGVSNPDGYVEVWLINTDGQRMVSVGVFAADRLGQFTVDEELIESGYRIVDLSNEPFDDEPRHSGDTIMRGELRF